MHHFFYIYFITALETQDELFWKKPLVNNGEKKLLGHLESDVTRQMVPVAKGITVVAKANDVAK